MAETTVKIQGRPTLKDEDKAVVFGELSLLKGKTPAYRAKRRELAVRFNYTEGAIEKLFERLKSAFLAKEIGRGSDNHTGPSSSTTPKDVAANSIDDPTA